MDFKLHNKAEITYKNETKVYYNTMLYSVFDRISNLSSYSKYLAVGSGTSQLNASDTKLTTFVKCFETSPDIIQTNILNGDLSVCRKVALGPNEEIGLAFSEIGLSYENNEDPTIVNHILMEDLDGAPTTIIKEQGESLEIKITIYLTLSSNDGSKFTAGNNPLIAALLGEEVYSSEPSFSIIKGKDFSSNDVSIVRSYNPTMISFEAIKSSHLDTESGVFSLNFSSTLETGTIMELLLAINEQIVMRLSCFNSNPVVETSGVVYTGTQGSFHVPENYVMEVLGVKDKFDVDVENYGVTYFAKNLGEPRFNPFGNSHLYSWETRRYTSFNGDRIAFIMDGRVDVFKNEGTSFVQLQAGSIVAEDIKKIVMINEHMFVFYLDKQTIRCYLCENDVYTEKQLVGMSAHADFPGASLSFEHFDATIINNGEVRFGVSNFSNKHSFMMRFSPDEEGNLIYAGTYDGVIEPAGCVLGVAPGPSTDGYIIFATLEDVNLGMYKGRFFVGPSTTIGEIENMFASYYLVKDVKEVRGCVGRITIRKTVSPYCTFISLPNFYYLSVSNKGEIDVATSRKDTKYIAKIFADGKVLFKYRDFSEIMMDFIDDIPGSIAGYHVKDVEFFPGVVVLFTTDSVNPTISIPLHEYNAFINGLSNDTGYKSTYKKGVPVNFGEGMNCSAYIEFS